VWEKGVVKKSQGLRYKTLGKYEVQMCRVTINYYFYFFSSLYPCLVFELINQIVTKDFLNLFQWPNSIFTLFIFLMETDRHGCALFA